MDTILKTTNLTKRFGSKTAVDQVSMNISKGDIYGFIGRNGAGKTTFMRVVLGMALPSGGSVELFPGDSREEACNKIGSLIEAPGIYPGCTAFENMKRFSIIYGGTDEEIREILQLVGLADTGRKKAGKFSLGMKQRLGIGIALLGNPQLLILDEPVNGLDPAGMKEVRDLLLKLNKERQITILISSHLLDELTKVVTRYGIINNGKLIEEISAKELEERCKHRLCLKVDDAPKAAEILATIVPQSDIEVSNGVVYLSSHLEEGAQFNQLLSKNDILVSGIEQESGGLEEYFMERIGVEA